MKIVINKDYGGFSLSDEATKRYAELKGSEGEGWNCRGVERNDPVLIQVVEEMGDAAGGQFASLGIVEIPDGVQWQIEEYDGMEWVAEKHRTWGAT
jgi:hypothetical protein